MGKSHWRIASGLLTLALAAGWSAARRSARMRAARDDTWAHHTAEADELLIHPDGTRRAVLAEGVDTGGAYLRIRHTAPPTSSLPGPHWHPIVAQTFTIEAGRARFVIDGRARILGPGEAVTVRPGQVHQFAHAGAETLVLLEEDRPPGDHRAMFALLCRLDRAGKLTARGIPTNPLLLGLLWERIDGYIAGPPPRFQRLAFGSLARLARLTGYAARWTGRHRGREGGGCARAAAPATSVMRDEDGW